MCDEASNFSAESLDGSAIFKALNYDGMNCSCLVNLFSNSMSKRMPDEEFHSFRLLFQFFGDSESVAHACNRCCREKAFFNNQKSRLNLHCASEAFSIMNRGV